jgi:hypothetical protein
MLQFSKEKILVSLLGIIFLLVLTSDSFATTPPTPCSKIGETVTVRGRFERGEITLFSPYPLCVQYPKTVSNGERVEVYYLPTLGLKPTSGIFVEVTGIPRDSFPVVGANFEVISFRDVDAEVKAMIAESIKRCEEWRAENTPILQKRAHGAIVSASAFPSPDAKNYPETLRCSLSAVDTISHEVIEISMPKAATSREIPSKPAKGKK